MLKIGAVATIFDTWTFFVFFKFRSPTWLARPARPASTAIQTLAQPGQAGPAGQARPAGLAWPARPAWPAGLGQCLYGSTGWPGWPGQPGGGGNSEKNQKCQSVKNGSFAAIFDTLTFILFSELAKDLRT